MIPGIIASTPTSSSGYPDGFFIISGAETGVTGFIMEQDGVPLVGAYTEWGYNGKTSGVTGSIIPNPAYLDSETIVGYIVARDSDANVYFGVYLDDSELAQDFFTSIEDNDLGILLMSDADYFGSNPLNDGAMPITTHWIFYLGQGAFEDFFPTLSTGNPLNVQLTK